MLWEFSAYICGEASGDRYVNFDKLNSIGKTAYVLGSELWEYNFDHLPSLVKEYVVGVWDGRKQKLYGDDLCTSQFQSLAEDLSWLELRGKRIVNYVHQVREEQTVRICLCVHVCVAMSMAVLLW